MVRKALSAVARVDRRFGLTAAVKLLAGLPDPRLQRAGLDRTPTFGALREPLRAVAHAAPAPLRHRGLGRLHARARSRSSSSPASGRAVMKGERPARLVLPREEDERPSRRAAAAGARTGRARATPEKLPAEAEPVFEALRLLRLELAREESVPAFVVASDRTLRDIALLRPRTLDELQLAHGIGPAKAERYGRRILEVVAAAAGPR